MQTTPMTFKNGITIAVLLLIIFFSVGKISKQVQTFIDSGTNLAQVSTAVTVSASITPATVYPGASAVLSWSSTNATSCLLDIGGASNIEQPASGSYTVTPAKSMNYVVKCSSATGSAFTVVPVIISPITLSFSASPTSVSPEGTSTLTWSATNATSCTASGAWSGNKESSGNMTVTILTDSTYTLTCVDSATGGSLSQSATVAIIRPAPTLSLSASPASIVPGQSSTLTWSATDATSCTASGGWEGTNGTSGSLSVAPPSSTTYTLDCTGTGGTVSKSVTVTVSTTSTPPPTTNKFIIGDKVQTTSNNTNVRSTAGGSRLGKQSKGAQGTVIAGPVQAAKSSDIYWNIDFVNAPDGWVAESLLIKVSPSTPPPTPLPTLSLSASPASITSGSSSTLSWSSTDATSCTAGGGWSGNKTTSGSEAVTPTTTSTYTLDCTGAGGTVSKSTSVTVSVPPPSTKFQVGDTIQTTTSVNVRDAANGNILGTQITGAVGTVMGGGTYAGGYHWWNIDYTNAPDGWSAENFLVKYTAPPVVALSATPMSITSGQSSTLSWSSTGATSCSATWTTSTATSGSQAVSPTATTTYTLNCTGAGGTTSQSVTVTVGSLSAPTVSFSASPTSITTGGSSTLTWSSTNATSCAASNGWIGTKSPSGTQSVAPTVTTTYTLDCTGTGGTTRKSVMVSVGTSGPITAPTLPLIFQVPMPTQTGKVWSVAAGDSTGFQNALNQAALGDTIELVAGSTYTGAFTFPNKTSGSGWIVVRSSKHASLPASGLRVNPSDAGNMAKIVSPGSNAIPVKFMPKSHHYRLIGLEVTLPTSITYTQGTIIGISPNSGNAADLPNNITLDRMYVHAQPTNNVQRCLQADGSYVAIIDSYFGDCHAKGFDSQAIVTFNTNGPIKIVNNHLEGAGENIMFGGADPAISGAITSDVEIRNNYIYTPASWGAGMTTKPWTKKNLFETKNVQRVLLEGNVLDGSWADGQVGYAFVLKSANQSGACTWCKSADITIRNNIIKNSAAGMNISGKEGSNPNPVGALLNNVLVENNVFENMVVAPYNQGDQIMFQVLQNVSNLTIRNNTVLNWGTVKSFINFGSNNKANATNFEFSNNINPFGTYGIFASGGTSGEINFTNGVAVGGTSVYSGNVIVGSQKSGYPTSQFVPDINTALTTGKGANMSVVQTATAKAVLGR